MTAEPSADSHDGQCCARGAGFLAAIRAEAAKFGKDANHRRLVGSLRLSEPTGDEFEVLKLLGGKRLSVGRSYCSIHPRPVNQRGATAGEKRGKRQSRVVACERGPDLLGTAPRSVEPWSVTFSLNA